MIQMGDAANGDGTGGSPLGTFADVFDPVLSFAGPGALAMANSGPDTNDSQFFVTEVPTTWLNQKHMIFGQVVNGAELVESIAQRSGTGSSPTPPVYLAGVDVIDSPQDGSVTIWAPDGWEGEATVTVQVTDPGGQVSEQQIDVLALGEPPKPVGELLIPAEPGVQGTASLPVVDGGGLEASVQVLCDDPNLDWTYDQATGEFTYTLAAGFTGAVDVRFVTIETAYEDSDREPGVHHVIVYSAGEDDPAVLSRIDTTDAQGRPLAPLTVVADGDRLYVGMYYQTDYDVAHALHVYDVADSSSPALLGTYALPAGDTWAQEIVIDGDVAYLAARGAGLIALDVSDPADMEPLGIGAGDPFAAGDLDLVGDTLYVAAFYEGLLAFDVSDPADIARIGQLAPYGDGNSISHVGIYGTTALVAEGRGLVSVNVTDPASMTYSAVEYDTTGVTVLAGEANRLYALDDTGQLLIFNVNSGHPTLAGTHAVDPASWNLSFDAYDVLTANNSGMQYLNTSDAANVQQWLAYEVSQFTGRPLRDGDLMYLPTWNAGVLVLDITPIL
jgi:cyclophilin family peptidyl-prolyl cis-trans isomerase